MDNIKIESLIDRITNNIHLLMAVEITVSNQEIGLSDEILASCLNEISRNMISAVTELNKELEVAE